MVTARTSPDRRDRPVQPDLYNAHRKGADIVASNRDLLKANLEYARVLVTPRMTSC